MDNMEEGKCRCGCGQATSLADRNRHARGWEKGKPVPYIQGHSNRYVGGPACAENERWCGRCKTVKTPADFFKNARATKSGGLQIICKVCSHASSTAWRKANIAKARRYNLKTRLRDDYGLTLADYDAMLERQAHRCAICHDPEPVDQAGHPRRMMIDHDHATGLVRGLLCRNCNYALGCLKDDPEIWLNAIAYLARG